MNNTLSFKIYSATAQLPLNWDELAMNNVFLKTAYFKVIENSIPENMELFYIGVFKSEELVGIAFSQFLDLNKLKSFGDRDKCFKTVIRNFIFKNFSSHVLFIGNNMLTGQNAFSFSDSICKEVAVHALKLASEALKNSLKLKGKKVHITTFKDFYADEIEYFISSEFKNNLQFSTQPNMVLSINERWKTELDYIEALSKKYRDQYKRARKKAIGLEKRKMHLEDIIKNEDTIYDLYFHVANNAPFNTFFLAKNHFSIFKEKMKDEFLFYGYFLDNQLIGFNTLIKNGDVMDTYFLGYDESIQREKMLYLNMLYDMIAYSIHKGFKKIVFARTALEIKSSVGAKPIKMYGFMEHSNSLINKNLAFLFNYLEPEMEWNERNPFK